MGRAQVVRLLADASVSTRRYIYVWCLESGWRRVSEALECVCTYGVFWRALDGLCESVDVCPKVQIGYIILETTEVQRTKRKSRS